MKTNSVETYIIKQNLINSYVSRGRGGLISQHPVYFCRFTEKSKTQLQSESVVQLQVVIVTTQFIA